MFEVDLDASDEGIWFQFQESHFDQKDGKFVFDEPRTDAKVRVRSVSDFISDRLSKRKRSHEMVLNPRTRQMERVSYFDDLSPEEDKKQNEDSIDFMITGLENFKNKATGEVLECTRENKLALMKIPAFDRFVGKCLRILSEVETVEKEKSEKNS